MKNLYLNFLLLSVLLVSCAKEEKNTVRIIAKGNQENYEQFVLNVASVQINYETSEGKTFWYILDGPTGMKDFASDDSWLMGSKNDLPQGKIKDVRLILKDGNYFEKDGMVENLQNKGIDKVINVELPVSDENVDVNLSFSLQESVVEKSRKFYFSPVISVN